MDSGSLLPKTKNFINRASLTNAVLLLTLAFFVWQMARITLAYLPYNTDVGFLEIKQEYIDIDVWRTAFFVHVYMSIWVLLAGFSQFSEKIRSYHPNWHRGLRIFLRDRRHFHHRPRGFYHGHLRQRRHNVKGFVCHARYRLDLFHHHGREKSERAAILFLTATL